MDVTRNFLRWTLTKILTWTPLQFWPVRVRAGMAIGARWTAFPFSSNWRFGGEKDVELAFNLLDVKVGATCWDLGAHFGIHTIGMARQVGDSGRVYAFEPDPVAFARLRRHVAMNRLNNVRLFNVAVSDSSGELELIVAGGLGSTVTHAKYEEEVVFPDAEILVSESVRLDALVAAGEVQCPTFIKVDVEGHAAKALMGALLTVRKTLPMIALSVHSPHEWQDCRSLLQPLGYTPIHHANKSGGWETPAGLETIVLAAPREHSTKY